jgi:type IV pilus assembly protein PilV
MDRPVLLNNKGVTLIEMMISLVITLIASLALMQTTLIGMNANLQNEIRDQAVYIAEKRMNELRGSAFSDLTATAPEGVDETAIAKQVRRGTVTYTPRLTITDVNVTTKQINVLISWSHKGQTYSHGIVSIISDHE